MRRRVLIVIALVAAGLLGPAAAAHAQCAGSFGIERDLAEADVAFVAKVVDRSNLDRTAVMRVLEVWKGPRLDALVTVNGGPENPNQRTSIDRTFLLDQIYLVLPANDGSPFQDSLCSGTQLWSTPTGTIPDHLHDAVGGEVPILVLGGPAGESASQPVAPDEGMNNIFVGMVAVGVALVIVFVGRRVGSLRRKPASRARYSEVSRQRHGVSPALVRRKRRGRRLAMSSPLRSRGPSRLDQVKKGSGRFRKGPGEHEKKQLERAVKLTATTPPSRRNHYTSGRRSAP